MIIHCLTHVPFEDAANIQVWADRHGHTLRYTHLYKHDPLPAMADFDLLAVMGGPMNVYEYDAYPWLKMEKHFIRRSIDAGKKVLGVCLGGQLIADTLGGKVTKNKLPEIGWHTITLTQEGRKLSLFDRFEDEFMVFHWHGDTFALPPKAIALASSKACTNQAFLHGSNVLGLQCHLEYSEASIRAMLKDCQNELIESPYVQNIKQIEQGLKWVSTVQGYLDTLLDRFVKLK
jgi:GMP synthase-like glutamine amidotransferase